MWCIMTVDPDQHINLINLIENAVTLFMITFWRELIEWLQSTIKNIKNKNSDAILCEMQVFLQKVGKKFKRIAKYFTRINNEEKWLKITTINEEYIQESGIPKNILAKAQNEQSNTIEITEETRQEIKLIYSYN